MVVAVRELDQDGLPDGQRNWANEHTVYTHGYGVVAAYGNQRDATTSRSPTTTASRCGPSTTCRPRASSTDMFQPDGYQPRIYFGEKSTDVLHRRQGPRGQERRARPPRGAGRELPDTTPTRATAGVADRRAVQQADVRHQVQRAQHRAVQPGQRELQDPLRPGAARAGAEGRAVADRRRRLLPGGGRRPGQVDPRRLHHDRPLPEQREGLVAVHDVGRAQPQHDVRHAAHRRDQLHAQLGQGRRRRVRRLA